MTNAIKISDLSLIKNNKTIFSNITFEVEKGSLCAICGKNGAGKSLLLKVIKGLEKQSSGTIEINGKDLSKDKGKRIRALGMVFQNADFQIVSETVEKDIAFGLENIKHPNIEEKVDEVIELLNLTKHRKQRPSTLSGGEKRKTAIAGIIAMEADIIFLDEPFANLDYPSIVTVLHTLLDLKKLGFTIVVVTHEIEKFLAHIDKVIILNEGKIAAIKDAKDSIEDLKKNEIFVPELPFEKITWL